MTSQDFKSNRIITNQSESYHQLLNHQTNKKDRILHNSNAKLKQFGMSLFNMLHLHRPVESTDRKTTDQQLEVQQQKVSLQTRPSIIKSPDLSRSLSKKCVVFAPPILTESNENKENDTVSRSIMSI